MSIQIKLFQFGLNPCLQIQIESVIVSRFEIRLIQLFYFRLFKQIFNFLSRNARMVRLYKLCTVSAGSKIYNFSSRMNGFNFGDLVNGVVVDGVVARGNPFKFMDQLFRRVNQHFGRHWIFKYIYQVLQQFNMENTYKSIIATISKIYEKYQKFANDKNEQKKKIKGIYPDKAEINFFERASAVKQSLITFAKSADTSTALTEGGEMKRYARIAADTLKYVENLLKKKNNLLVKVNKALQQLARVTIDTLAELIKQLTNLNKKEGGFLCCGSGTNKNFDKFRDDMGRFRECSANWKFLNEIQPKENCDNYIIQQFQEKQFSFIKDILARNWPNIKPPEKPAEVIVQKKVEVIKQVVKQVVKYVDNGKPNILSIAHEWLYGINRQVNPAIALQIYHEQADKNDNGAACTIIGAIYETGHYLPRDYNKAVNYYKKATTLKDSYGTYLYAKSLENGLLRENYRPTKDDLALAYKLLTQASDSGCIQAMVDYASILENGNFDAPNEEIFTINKDLKKAMNLYIKARNQRSPKASNNLGIFYLKNKYMDQSNPNNVIEIPTNCERNINKAIQYLTQSAHRGFVTAYYNLGTLYQRGEGVKQNLEKAQEYFHQGASKGDNKCKVFYAFYLMDQTSIYKENFQQQYKIAIRWLEDVINNSNKMDQVQKSYYYLGMYYQYGFGVESKPKKAVQCYQKAAYLQYAPAINRLGHCYFSGFGVKTDKTIAIGYYKQAAERQNDQAMVNLGTAYLTGIPNILEKNPAIAYEYFESAMKAGNTDAYVHLSQMYQIGMYVKQDQKLSRQLLGIAALKKNQTAIYMLNQRGIPIDEQIMLKLQQQVFIRPKPLNTSQTMPYIKDLSKAKK